MAEISYTPFGKKGTPVRLIVGRVPPSLGSQLALFAAYGYHACICDREGRALRSCPVDPPRKATGPSGG